MPEPAVQVDHLVKHYPNAVALDGIGFRVARGATILLASHNMAEVERLCSEVLMMKAGRIVDRGSPQALVGRYGRTNLEEVFLQIARRPEPLMEPVA